MLLIFCVSCTPVNRAETNITCPCIVVDLKLINRLRPEVYKITIEDEFENTLSFKTNKSHLLGDTLR